MKGEGGLLEAEGVIRRWREPRLCNEGEYDWNSLCTCINLSKYTRTGAKTALFCFKKKWKMNSEKSSAGLLPIAPKLYGLRHPAIWKVLKLCFPDSTDILFSCGFLEVKETFLYCSQMKINTSLVFTWNQGKPKKRQEACKEKQMTLSSYIQCSLLFQVVLGCASPGFYEHFLVLFFFQNFSAVIIMAWRYKAESYCS